MSGITQALHQFAFHRQEVIKTDEDEDATGELGLHVLVLPMLDHGALPHTRVTFSGQLHLGAQGLV